MLWETHKLILKLYNGISKIDYIPKVERSSGNQEIRVNRGMDIDPSRSPSICRNLISTKSNANPCYLYMLFLLPCQSQIASSNSNARACSIIPSFALPQAPSRPSIASCSKMHAPKAQIQASNMSLWYQRMSAKLQQDPQWHAQVGRRIQATAWKVEGVQDVSSLRLDRRAVYLMLCMRRLRGGRGLQCRDVRGGSCPGG